jgi:hypothetical protein
LEYIVLWDDAARRQLASSGGHFLHRSAQPDLLLEQTVARRAVLC